MPRPPRTPKKGDIPVAQETQRVSRVRTIRLLMSEFSWRNEASKMAFCQQWKCSPATMDDYVREARRTLRDDVADHPEALVHPLTCGATAPAADMVRNIEDQVEQDDKGNTVSAIGKEGKKSWPAYAQLNQAILGAMSQLTSLVANHGGAFIPKEQRGDDANNTGMPSVQVVVKYHTNAVPPAPAEAPPAPPADPKIPPQ